MQVFQIITFFNTAMKLLLLLQMKYRTRFPTCSLHGRYTSGSLDTTLSLKHPGKTPSCRTSPCFVCKSDTLLHALERETQVVERKKNNPTTNKESDVLMQKNKSSASVKKPQIFKVQMKAVFSTQFYKRRFLYQTHYLQVTY